MKNSLDTRLINAIRNRIASFSTDRAIPGVFAIARDVISHEEPLIAQWTLEKVARAVQRQLEAVMAPRSNPYMDFLPGLVLSDPLPLRKGFIALGEATIQKLRESVLALKMAHKERAERRLAAEVGRLKRLIIEMAPYARMNHGLTVERYCELRAAGVEAGAKLKPARVTAGK
jgi:hypothetical protein